MVVKKGLGKKGLGNIFGDEVIKPNQLKEGMESFVKISEVEPNKNQPRKQFDQETLNDLANSIKQYGVLQPILVQKKDDYYEIIAGERRWRASKLAGLKEIPIVVKEYSDQMAMEIALIENIQRTDLNPLEEALAYQELIEKYSLKQDEIAQRVSKSRSAITNSLRLLKLDNYVQELLIKQEISMGHARAILSVENSDMQQELAQRIISQQLSVREVEKIVKNLEKPNVKKEPKEKDRALEIIFQELEERMKIAMGTKVSINQKDRNKGRIEIEYYSDKELERIVEMLESIK